MGFDEMESVGDVGYVKEKFNKQGVRLLPSKPKSKKIKKLSESAQIRRLPEYLLWIYEVWENNPRRCFYCESKENLTIHHKKPISKILSEKKMLRNQLWDINNGVILCETCHKKIHITPD